MNEHMRRSGLVVVVLGLFICSGPASAMTFANCEVSGFAVDTHSDPGLAPVNCLATALGMSASGFVDPQTLRKLGASVTPGYALNVEATFQVDTMATAVGAFLGQVVIIPFLSGHQSIPASAELISGIVTSLGSDSCTISNSSSGAFGGVCIAQVPLDGANPTVRILQTLIIGAQNGGSADYLSTAGIESVTFLDANGNPVPGVTLNFADGSPFPVGHPAAVPIPATLPLLAAGLAWLGGLVRRQERRK